MVVEFKELRRKYFQDFNEDRKAFAMKYSKTHELFGIVMKTLNTPFTEIEKVAEVTVKEYILKQCKSLNDAKKYIEGL